MMKMLRGLLAGVLAIAGVAQAGTVTYYHNDIAGSPVVASDASGNEVWRESYRPYGERLTNAPASVDNKVWFTSRRQDAETGLVYMGARYYDPVLARFISTDPVGFNEENLHSHNRYAYANNNPYKYVDPDGKAGVLATTAAGAGAGTLMWPGPGTIIGGAVGFGVGAWGTWKLGNLIFNENGEGVSNPQPTRGGSANDAGGEPRQGEAGGPGAGKVFGERTRDRIRDRDDNKCVLCGKETAREPGPDQSQIDHAWPKSRGGNNSDNNGQNTCRTCNRDKGTKTTGEYVGGGGN